MKKAAIIVFFLIAMSSAFFLIGCKPAEDKLTTYEINGVINTSDMTMTASEKVSFVNTYGIELDSVYFHLYPAAYREDARFSPISDMYTSKAYPNGVDYGGIEIGSVLSGGKERTVEIGGQDEDILMVTGLAISAGSSIDIEISFSLDIPQLRHRFGYYGDTINLGNWYPILSVFEDGNWRTDPYYSNGDPFYSDIANYKVSLTAPSGWTVASTGTTLTSIDGESATTTMQAEKVRDFAVVVGKKLQTATAIENGVNIRYYYDSDANSGYRLNLIKDSIRTFGELFGAYPYPQLSVVKTHFVHGGMEYPQLVYVSDVLNESLFDESIIHEIAHQWWYAVVGNDEIREAWLDEGLAEYATSIFYEKNPSYGVNIADRISDAMKGYILFSEIYQVQASGVWSMNRDLSNYFNSHDYVYHSYVKSELFFDSLRHLIGEKNFFDGLKSYYSANMFKNAGENDLLIAFEKTSGLSLGKFFSNWLEGKVSLYASVTIGGPDDLIEH